MFPADQITMCPSSVIDPLGGPPPLSHYGGLPAHSSIEGLGEEIAGIEL